MFASIRFRLIAGFVLIAASIVAMARYFGRFVERQQEGLERLRVEQQSFFVLNRVANSFVAYQAASINKDSSEEHIDQTRREFEARLAEYAERDAQIAEQVLDRVQAYAANAQRMREAARAGDAAALAEVTGQMRASAIALGTALRKGFDAVDQRYKSLLDQEMQTQRRWQQAFQAAVAAALAAFSRTPRSCCSRSCARSARPSPASARCAAAPRCRRYRSRASSARSRRCSTNCATPRS